MATLKELSARPDNFTGGHRLCVGCGAGIAARQVLMSAKTPIVVTCATGCLEVASTIFPYSAWRVPWFHSAFENSAATASGIESAYKALKKRGKIPAEREIRFIAFGGDGGTYDIGFQSLSGAMERGHRLLYVCYDNQAYMNTGVQRSSATPKGAHTTTAPVGKQTTGKEQYRKDITACMVAHHIPYVAQTAIGFWKDLTAKVEKALDTNGPSFIVIHTPCMLGWEHAPELTCELGRLAVDTCSWPLYEVVNGEYKLTYKPTQKKPLVEWLKLQGRFKHLFLKENEEVQIELQAQVNKEWEELLRKCGVSSG